MPDGWRTEVYDRDRFDYETLAKLFYHNDEQKRVAEKLIGILRHKGLDVVTKVRPAARRFRIAHRG